MSDKPNRVERDREYERVRHNATRMFRGAVLLIAVGFAILLIDGWVAADWNERGVRGDYLGGHLAAFAGLASFMIVTAALWLQSEELKQQRLEIEESREVAQEQAKALNAQQGELAEQNRIARDQADVQFIMTLSRHVMDARVARREAPGGPLVEHRAMLAQIVMCAAERALIDVRRSYELCELIAASVSTTDAEWERVLEIVTADPRLDVHLARRADLETAKPWKSVAADILARRPTDWRERYAGKKGSK